MVSRMRRRQRGVTLIIAMIILGAMMLSGIAMFRKLSASAMISGNLAFTNSAIAGADFGAESARAWLMLQSGRQLFTGAQFARGYFPAHCYTLPADEVASRNCGTSATPADFDPTTFDWTNQATVVTTNDGAGNDVRYVVHRLCNVVGSLDTAGQSCVLALQTNAGSGGHGTVTYGTQQLSTTMRPYYRVTTRVRGPRNATVYTQITMF